MFEQQTLGLIYDSSSPLSRTIVAFAVEEWERSSMLTKDQCSVRQLRQQHDLSVSSVTSCISWQVSIRSKTRETHDSALMAAGILWSPVRQTCGLRIPCMFVSEYAGTRGFPNFYASGTGASKWVRLVEVLLWALERNMAVLPARLIFMHSCLLRIARNCCLGADPCYEPCKQV